MAIGLNTGIYLGANALQAQTLALTTTGNNIANANTPGATRQVVDLTEDISVQTQSGSISTGVYADQVRSVRSDFLDNQVQQQTSQLNYAKTNQNEYTLLQNSFGEDITNNQVSATTSTSTGTGIQTPLDAFYSAWQSLAGDPTNSVYRDAVSSASGELANQISGAYNQILTTKGNSFTQATDATQQINVLSAQIAQLNAQISTEEGQMVKTGQPGIDPQANSLRDQRQQDIETLAQYIPLKETPNQGPLQDQTNIEIPDANGNSQTPPVYLVYQRYGAGATDGTNNTVRLDVVATDPTAAETTTGVGTDAKTSANVNGGQYDRSTNSVMTVVASTATTAGLTPPKAPILQNITSGAPVDLTTATNPLSAALKTTTLFDNLSTSGNKTIPGGSLGAFVDQANNVIGVGQGSNVGGSTVEKFNNFVNQLVTEVDTQFNLGYNNETPATKPTGTAASAQTGTTADTLFSLTGTNSSTLALNNIYNINNSKYDRNAFPASGANGAASLGSLDGSNASAISQLSQAPSGVTTNSTPTPVTYRTVISAIGTQTSVATANATQTNLILQQTTAQRSSISGINMDEELSNLTAFQQAYSASARFISVVNDMLTNLIQNL